MANAEGLQKTLEYIKDHPSEWDQMRWSTCFAGIALRVLKDAELSESGCCNLCRDVMIDGKSLKPHEVDLFAREALELTHAQAATLFHGSNDLDALTALVEEYSEATVPA